MDPARDRGSRRRPALGAESHGRRRLARVGHERSDEAATLARGATRSLWRSARRQLRPPRTLRPTRAGWVFFLLTLGVGLASLNTGNNLLYLVQSLLLAFLVLSGVMSESALRGIRLRRRLPAELFAERASPIAIEIHNAQRRVPAFAVVIEDLLGCDSEDSHSAGRVFALRVGPGATETRSYLLTPAARGALDFAGFRVTTRFPFGLFSKAMRVEQPGAALVYPALDPFQAPPPVGARERRGETHGGSGGDSSESAGLRRYAPGDAFRRVHWRATLRRGELLVREPEHEQSAEHVVRLRTSAAEPGAGFEAAVRRAASEVVAQLATGRRVGLRTDSASIAPATGALARRHLLGLLAVVAPDAGSGAPG